MKKMGLKSYRFSVSWSRILPDGTGKINQKGIAFYQSLVRELKAAGIEPMVTLYHWDLPYALYLQGGWKNPQIPDWFAAYTKIVVEALSDQVQYWMTLNEPQCFVGIGHLQGRHAPFLDEPASLRPVTRHVLLAHAKAVQTIRQYAKLPPKVGYAPTGPVFSPCGDESEAAPQGNLMDAVDSMDDGTRNTKPMNISTMPTAAASVRPRRLAIIVMMINAT